MLYSNLLILIEHCFSIIFKFNCSQKRLFTVMMTWYTRKLSRKSHVAPHNHKHYNKFYIPRIRITQHILSKKDVPNWNSSTIDA